MVYHKVVLCDRHGDARNIDLLKGVLADERHTDVAGDGDHGDRVHIRGCNASDQVGRARARGRQAHADLAGRTGIAVCRVRSALLVGGQYVTDAVAILIKRIVNIEDSAARIAENRVDTLLDQGLAQNL